MATNDVEAKAKKYYPKYWTLDDLKKLVENGKLSKAAYKRVTGETYPN